MGYEDVQELHEKELLAMGISRDEAKEIMAAEEEYGVSFRDTWDLELDNPSAIRQMLDDDKNSGFDYEG
ncbi:MAG: hypothetical protein ACI4NX_06425 [Megasphaera elsdenii]|uniref:hypothetical protein n=1 Tax=Megasphaera TaxID=906 RepID=UPI002430CEAE|nr:hypothetical protein [Megasphaera elsdenii]